MSFPYSVKIKINLLDIGLSISLTGNYSIQGIESFEGIKLWVSDVNRQGGIYLSNQDAAFPIELIHYDDESSLQKCKSNTEKLILEDEVDLLLGPYSSSLALASCEIAEEHNKTLWNHGGSTDEIKERGFNCVINAITPASNYSHGIIDALIEADPYIKKIATFSAENSGFSTRVSNGAKEYAESQGLNVREYKFISGTEDFSDQLDDLDSYQPDLILGMGRAEDDLALAEQLFSKEIDSKAAGFIVASIKLFKDKFNKKIIDRIITEKISPTDALTDKAKQTAESQDQDGWMITLQFPSYQAIMTYADDRELRREHYEAYSTRASDQASGNEQWDNSLLMEEILALRHEKAQLLGFKNYAELSLATKMAKQPDEVINFLEDLADKSWRQARKDFADLQSFAKQYYGINNLQSWDLTYYSEKMRQHFYQLSQEAVKAYFPITRVLPGLFAVVEKLYGLQISEISDFDSWHPDVRFFEIHDEFGVLRGKFYFDLY